jgi:hypothetical protein
MPDRSPYDGEPFYCASCGFGFAEFLACEEPDCEIETKDEALQRAADNKSQSRPKRFLEWSGETFGPIAFTRGERLSRFIEEAIELAHAEGMKVELLNRISARVYSRQAGELSKEIGQAQATLEMFAESIGLSSDAEAAREWERVRGIPKEEWQRRHAAKIAIGI